MTRREQANVMVRQVAISLPAVISAIIVTIGATRVYYGDRSALVEAQDLKMHAMEARIVSAVSKEIAAVKQSAEDKIALSNAERWTATDQARWIARARANGIDNLPDVWEIKHSSFSTPSYPILRD